MNLIVVNRRLTGIAFYFPTDGGPMFSEYPRDIRRPPPERQHFSNYFTLCTSDMRIPRFHKSKAYEASACATARGPGRSVCTFSVLRLNYSPSGECGKVRYTAAMTLMTRTAVLQARVRPEIKFAGEQVLRSIGLTMTEAMELFLRRLIVDQKLPFEVAALDDATVATIVVTWEARGKEKAIDLDVTHPRRPKKRPKRE
jgi:DNA-damage-inducible protein J